MAGLGVLDVPKRKAGASESAKRRTTLVRVYEDFAEMVASAAGADRLSYADWINIHLMPVADRISRDAFTKRGRRPKGGDE